jgi:tetratricopeptide (TPR) repeat protein
LLKYLIILILLFPGPSGLRAANPVADSLRQLLEVVPYPERIDILNELSRSYWHDSIEKSIDYASQALEIARDTENSKGMADALNRLGNARYMMGDHAEAIDYYYRSLEIRLEIDDHRGILGSYNNLYLAWNYLGEPGTAVEYIRKAADLSIESGNVNDIARYSNILGNASTDLHDFENARPALRGHLKFTGNSMIQLTLPHLYSIWAGCSRE